MYPLVDSATCITCTISLLLSTFTTGQNKNSSVIFAQAFLSSVMTSNEWALKERCNVLAAFQTTADATRTNSWSGIHSSFSICLWKTNLQCLSWFMIFPFSFWISADVSFLYVCSFIPTSLNCILLEFATNFRLLIARLQNGRGFRVKWRIWLVIKPIFVVLNMKIWVVFEANKGQPCTLHQSNILGLAVEAFFIKNKLFKSQNEILDVCINVNLLIYFSTLKSVRFAFITDIVPYILCTFAKK